MISTKPYLIRAIHEWCIDAGFTPYLAVTVDAFTRVPREFVKDGQIVLNVGFDATSQLQLGNEEISFQARFGGKAFPVFVPIDRVSGIYARENGQGMAFEISELATDLDSNRTPEQSFSPLKSVAKEPSTSEEDGSPPRSPVRPVLTRIK